MARDVVVFGECAGGNIKTEDVQSCKDEVATDMSWLPGTRHGGCAGKSNEVHVGK